jgi:hypothetical protein
MTKCKRGHNAGRYSNGNCRECQRIWQIAYKRRTRRDSVPHRATAIWHTARGNAKRRGIKFTITRKHVQDLLESAVRLGWVSMEISHPSSASIDREDSLRGYVRGNVQIIPCWLNRAARNWPKQLVLKEIRRWLKHQKGR